MEEDWDFTLIFIESAPKPIQSINCYVRGCFRVFVPLTVIGTAWTVDSKACTDNDIIINTKHIYILTKTVANI